MSDPRPLTTATHPEPRRFGIDRLRTGMTMMLLGLLAACASSQSLPPGDQPVSPGGSIGVPEGEPGYRDGVVTAAHPLAAEAGREVLEAGGNAIDASIAVQFVLNVVEPTSSGIGGGGFMGVHLADEERTFFIDSREKAPAAASPTMYLQCDPDCTANELTSDDGPATIGQFGDVATSGIAVGVPGTLLGIDHALDRYGSGQFSLAQLIEPAITLAAEGFPITDRLASQTGDDRVGYWPETTNTFRTADGTPRKGGDILVQPDLAKTFRMIAEQGSAALYGGPVASAIIDAQARARDIVGEPGQGRMTLADLAAYHEAGVIERKPVLARYRGYTIAGMPSPSSGGNTVGQILACLERFPIGDAAAGFGPGELNTIHVMAESMRLAFSSRSIWMGDADAVELPDEGLLAPGYLQPRCAMIDIDSRIDNPEPGDPRPFDPTVAGQGGQLIAQATSTEGVDTTHFTVIDSAGNVVSWTSTIEGTWGTGMTVPGYGFLLNNELTDFNFTPQANGAIDSMAPGANDVAAGKRPRSSMSPSLLFNDDRLLAAYGSPGGSTIINTVVQMTTNLIDHGMTVQEAIDAPRFHTSGGSLYAEPAFAPDVLDGLTALGHEVSTTSFSDDDPYVQGSVQAVVIDPETGLQYGGADARRVGTVAGIGRQP